VGYSLPHESNSWANDKTCLTSNINAKEKKINPHFERFMLSGFYLAYAKSFCQVQVELLHSNLVELFTKLSFSTLPEMMDSKCSNIQTKRFHTSVLSLNASTHNFFVYLKQCNSCPLNRGFCSTIYTNHEKTITNIKTQNNVPHIKGKITWHATDNQTSRIMQGF
jgi:hypothetical protein